MLPTGEAAVPGKAAMHARTAMTEANNWIAMYASPLRTDVLLVIMVAKVIASVNLGCAWVEVCA